MKTMVDKATQAVSDAAITAEIKAKLLADDFLSMFEVHVETGRGVVTLTGSLSNIQAIEKVVSIAKKTNGVINVINHIKRK